VLVLMLAATLVAASLAAADPIPVRVAPQPAHVPLVLRDSSGHQLASGEWTQTVDGDRAVGRLVFHFADGSLYDETTTFSARGVFQLITDHLIERGPSFPQALDLIADPSAGRVTVRTTDSRGRDKTDVVRMALSRDLANGLIPTFLENLDPARTSELPRVGYLAAMAKPRLVTLAITRAADETVALGGATQRARHYVLKVEIGGFAGALAPLVGKQPPDSHVWILDGDMPSFYRSEQPLYVGGPLWRIELAPSTP
jgi:hypothetical protein